MKRLVAGFALVVAFAGTSTCPASAQLPAFTADQLTKRAKTLLVRIDDAVLDGRLASSEADSLKAKLRSIQGTQEKYVNDGLVSNWESLTLSFQLDGISKKLESIMVKRSCVSQNTDGRQIDINQRIDDAQAAGQLTDKEALALKADLDKIATKEDKFRKAGGALSEDQKMEICIDLDLLSKAIEDKLQARTVNLPDLDVIKKDVQQKLAQAQATGKIPAAQLDQLKRELNKVIVMESDLKGAENKLTTEESVLLAVEYEQLDNMVSQYMKGATPQANAK